MEANMTTISVTDARSKLYKLMDQAREESEPILITGKRGNVVLVSEDDWRAIQETLYLISIPGMRESILEGMAEPVDDLGEEPGW
jgi:prevent-host-death family protein